LAKQQRTKDDQFIELIWANGKLPHPKQVVNGQGHSQLVKEKVACQCGKGGLQTVFKTKMISTMAVSVIMQ